MIAGCRQCFRGSYWEPAFECGDCERIREEAEAERRDADIREAREDQRHRAPHWMFGELEPRQARNCHPAHHPRVPAQRRAGPRSISQFAKLVEL